MAARTALNISAPQIDIERGPRFAVGQYLPLDQIRIDGGTQARAGLDDATVAEYAESWLTLSHKQNGFLEMPLIVVYHDGESYWLADGFHRVEAYKRFVHGPSASASPHAIRAEVRQGTRRDAVLYACGANSTHGLRRTNADKRRAIVTILEDHEWQQWSDSEIARRCAVDHKTVANVRAELYPGNSQDSRTVARSGTTYQMKPPAAKEVKQPYSMEQAFPRALRKRAESLGVAITTNFSLTDQKAAVWIPGESTSRWISVADLSAWCDAQAKQPAAPPLQPRFPALAGDWFYAHHRNESRGVLFHIWRPEPSRSAKVRFVSACGMAMQHEEPRPVADLAQSTLVLCAQCQQAPQLQQPPGSRTQQATSTADDSATMDEIRTLAHAHGLEVVWEDDQVLLSWPGEDLDVIEPMSYRRAIDWLESEAGLLRPLREQEQPRTIRPARTAGRAITLGLTEDECRALYGEDAQFLAAGLRATYPTIAGVLTLLINGIEQGS